MSEKQPETLRLEDELREAAHGYDEWRVQSPSDGSYCMSFSWKETMSPDRDARTWLAGYKSQFPNSQFSEYVVEKVHVLTREDRLMRQAAAPTAPDHSATAPTVRIGNAKVAVFDEAYVADLAEKAATVPAEVPMPDGWQTELLDWVSACQSAYHIDNTPNHRFGGLASRLDDNRADVVEFVEGLLSEYGDAREAAGYALGLEAAGAIVAQLRTSHIIDAGEQFDSQPCDFVEAWTTAEERIAAAAQKGGE